MSVDGQFYRILMLDYNDAEIFTQLLRYEDETNLFADGAV